jgi:chorismate dehydratase
MKVGRISYLNTAPYFHYWPSDGFAQVSGAPRELAMMAARGAVDAGPLPLVECWGLENEFEFLGRWGIASREKSGSVFVMSRKPFDQLGGATIGVTQDTSTSAMLCELLLKTRYGLKTRMKRGLETTDDAWLVIGDQALGLRLQSPHAPWTHVTDLATEWWRWQAKPFVFARWVVRRTAAPGDKARLEWLIGESLDKGLANLAEVAERSSYKSGFQAEIVERYLKDLIYDIDADAEEGMRIFRNLLDEAGILRLPVGSGKEK